MQALSTSRNQERVWALIKVAAKVDTAMDVRGNFIRRPAQNVKRNAKFLSSQAVIVRSTAKIAIPKRRVAAAESSAVFGFTLSPAPSATGKCASPSSRIKAS
jgi:hypothetical protein